MTLCRLRLLHAAAATKNIVLKVFNIKCHNLKGAADHGKSSNPYVKVVVGTEKAKTETVSKNVSPAWPGVEFTFGGDKQNLELVPRVEFTFHHDTFGPDHSLGACSVSFDSLWPHGNAAHWCVGRQKKIRCPGRRRLFVR